MRVNILGQDYTVEVKKYNEDEAFKDRSIDGYCDWLTKEIVLCDMTTWPGWGKEPVRTVNLAHAQTLRHEIVHAFLYESGLGNSARQTNGPWAKNEEMVDWVASQGPKIYAAWREAGAL